MLEAPAIMEILKKGLIQYSTSNNLQKYERCTLQEHEMQNQLKCTIKTFASIYTT